MAKLLKIAKTKDVPPGQAAAFTIEGQKIALFNVEGTYYAIGDTCTHRGGPLSEGDVQGTRVTCPWHGADFDLKTGAVLGPPAQEAFQVTKSWSKAMTSKWKYRISRAPQQTRSQALSKVNTNTASPQTSRPSPLQIFYRAPRLPRDSLARI